MKFWHKFTNSSDIWLMLLVYALSGTSGDLKSSETLVVDRLLSEKEISTLRDQLVYENAWRLQLESTSPESFGPYAKCGYEAKGVYISPSIRETLNTKVLNTVKPRYGDHLRIDRISAFAIERSDFTSPTSSCHQEGVALKGILIVNEDVDGNSYGEVVMYEGESHGIHRSTSSQAGRLILVPCSFHYRVTPPAIAVSRPVIFLTYDFTDRQASTEGSGTAGILENSALKPEIPLNEFVMLKMISDQYEVQYSHIKPQLRKTFITPQGNSLLFADHVIPTDVLNLLVDYIQQHVVYITKTISKETFLCRWLPWLREGDVSNSTYWKFVSKLVPLLTNNSAWYPYQVLLISRKTTFDDKVHSNSPNEKEYSIIIDLSNITDSAFGETVFYESKEVVAAIRSKFGRVIVFPGVMEYSIRSQGSLGTGMVWKLLIKATSSQLLAWKKILRNKENLPIVKTQIKSLPDLQESTKAELLEGLDKVEVDLEGSQWSTEVKKFLKLAEKHLN